MDLSVLNEQQRIAALHTKGAVLILAGAGSGKTRVLTHRIAYLIEDLQLPPWQILAITFTNKAADEMRHRLAQMVPQSVGETWISTFHSMCLRMLRKNADRIGRQKDFTVYDDDDQGKVIDRILKALNMSDKYFPPREVRGEISSAKDKGWDAATYAKHGVLGDFHKEQIAKVYAVYEQTLADNNAMDFDDLILMTLKLFKQCPDVLRYYADKFHYIHVDEYQDTNHAQYLLVKQLSSVHGNLCVVGDDDQSIYSWRGADIRNILEFEEDFPDALVVRLEQNYRSTTPILTAANGVIARNQGRKDKNLWTDKPGGEKVFLHVARDERAEAEFVCQEIRRLLRHCHPKDVAVLYRTHAQSRVMEEMMIRTGVAYRVFGGQKFYDRKEVKDILAYLRVLRNPHDNVSFLRVVNNPRRGIGDSALEELLAAANERGESLMLAALQIDELPVSERLRVRIKPFAQMMRNLMLLWDDMIPIDFIDKVVRESGYAKQYEEEGTPEAQDRLDNIKELMGAVRQFQDSMEGGGTLDAFLDNAALISDFDNLSDERTAITLMTLHGAKGLEFKVVFVIGLEEGVFPHSRSLGDAEQMEEERRLCYVGITRGMDKVYLTRAMRRLLYNRVSENMPARFLSDIPASVLVEDNPNQVAVSNRAQQNQAGQAVVRRASSSANYTAMTSGKKPQSKPASSPNAEQNLSLKVGDKVKHSIFGQGTVVSLMGEGAASLVAVAFDGKGVKQLALSVAPLTKMEKET